MNRTSGFSLIEILIVLAIAGILASLAYPSYASYVTRSRRIEGQLALMDILQQQERFYTLHNTYVAFSADSTEPEARRFRWWSGGKASDSAYELRGEACAGRSISECIEVRALPGTERVNGKFIDTGCGTLSLNSVGQRTASGASDQCWP